MKKIFAGSRPLVLMVLVPLIFVIHSGFSFSREQFDRRTPLVIAVKKVGPAVVNINTKEAAPKVNNPFRSFNFGDNLFEKFFNDVFPSSRAQRRSLGSGVIISPEGYILTNEHVVAKAVQITVTLIDKREFDARLVGADIKSDLAIIKIDSPEKLPHVEMGRSDDLMIGETVLAIGNPFGLQHTVTTGIISALNRSIRARKNLVYHDFIQLDASINPGNSGGPLLNINGALIGINTAIFQEAEGIGFAIPIDNAKRIVDDLISFGKVRRGWIGVSVQDMTQELRRHFKLERGIGAMVVDVVQGSPGARGGVKRGDIILSIDDHEISGKAEYMQRVASYSVGNSIRFSLLREGKDHSARVKVRKVAKNYVAQFALNRLGFRVTDIGRVTAQKYQLSTRSGVVVVEVIPNGTGGRRGIRPGDVIRQVNQNKVKNEADFNKAIIDAGNRDTTLLLVQRGRYGYYVTLAP